MLVFMVHLLVPENLMIFNYSWLLLSSKHQGRSQAGHNILASRILSNLECGLMELELYSWGTCPYFTNPSRVWGSLVRFSVLCFSHVCGSNRWAPCLALRMSVNCVAQKANCLIDRLFLCFLVWIFGHIWCIFSHRPCSVAAAWLPSRMPALIIISLLWYAMSPTMSRYHIFVVVHNVFWMKCLIIVSLLCFAMSVFYKVLSLYLCCCMQ